MKTLRSGFTLLELLIVVIVVSILAAVALPRFGKMTRRSRAAEATNVVGALLTAEFLYYNEHGVFTTTQTRLMVEVPANSNFNYTVTYADAIQVMVRAASKYGTPEDFAVFGNLRNDGARVIWWSGDD